MQTQKDSSSKIHFTAIDVIRGLGLSGTLINSILEYQWKKIPESWFLYIIQFIFVHPLDNRIGFADVSLPAFLMLIGATQVFSVQRQRSQNKPSKEILSRLLLRCLLFILATYCLGVGSKNFYYNPTYVTEYSVELAFTILISGLSAIYLGGRAWLFLMCAALIIHGVILWEIIQASPHYANNPNYPDLFIRTSITNYIFNTPNQFRYPQGTTQHYVYYLLRLPRLLSICFLGNLLGLFYLNVSKPSRRALIFCISGILFVLFGWCLSPIIPIARKSWTPSYVLLNCGLAFLFISLAEFLCKKGHEKRYLQFLIIFGRNPLITWLSFSVLPLSFMSYAILSYLPVHFSGAYLPIYNVCIQLTISWLVIYAYDYSIRRYRRSSTE